MNTHGSQGLNLAHATDARHADIVTETSIWTLSKFKTASYVQIFRKSLKMCLQISVRGELGVGSKDLKDLRRTIRLRPVARFF